MLDRYDIFVHPKLVKWLSFSPIVLLLFLVLSKESNRTTLQNQVQGLVASDTISNEPTTSLPAQSQDILQKMESWQTAYNDAKDTFTAITKQYKNEYDPLERGKLIHQLDEAYNTLVERYSNETTVVQAALEQICNKYDVPATLTEKGVRYKTR